MNDEDEKFASNFKNFMMDLARVIGKISTS